jgi:hypothetical protein
MARSTKDRSHFVETRITNLGLVAKRCQAFRKRSNDQCGQFALSGKNVCAVHGGRSTGAKTPEGKERIRLANTTIGTESVGQRAERHRKMRELATLEAQMQRFGMLG